MVHLERKGWLREGGGYLQIKIFKFFCQQKNTGKRARVQGKHREFDINGSVATLYCANARLQIGLKLSHIIIEIGTCAVYFVKIVHCCRMCWLGLCAALTNNLPIYGES